MHTGPVLGDFVGQPEKRKHPCPYCKGTNVVVRQWESSDGAYEDERVECLDCKRVWWNEGADA